MKLHLLVLSLMTLFVGGVWAWADGDHAAPKGVSRFGENSAVTAFDPEEGFKMKPAALDSLGVQFKKLEGSGPWNVPKAALVHIKHASGVYRRFEGWISFVLVQGATKGGATTVQSEDLQPGDEIAVEGASFLRMTEADLNADTVDSCSH